MLEKQRPKVILLEDNEAILQSANAVLLKQGWDVTCKQVSKEALETLKQDNGRPFALFISNFKLPLMEGDDILHQVKTISPSTQRMLMVPSDEPDILIKAINKAEIHACITAPFKEEDLVHHTRNCFRQFRREIKRQRLKRVTVHQNKQMFRVAQKLKKKDSSFQKLIEEKKNNLLKLKSEKRAFRLEKSLTSRITLPIFIEHKSISPQADTFFQAFTSLCKTINLLFDHFCDQNALEPIPLDMDQVFQDNNETGVKEGEQHAEADNDPTDKNMPVKPESQDSDPQVIAEQIIKYALTCRLDTPEEETVLDQGDQDNVIDGNPISRYLDIRLSENQTKAFVKRKQGYDPKKAPAVSDFLDWLSENSVSYGIIEDEVIETWLRKSAVDEIVVAQGEDPVLGQPGIVTYHFESDFTNPGKINEDGSIDFRDRGDIPFVVAGTLLAQKKPAVQGQAGISVSSIPLPVGEVADPVFTAGSGVEISDDQMTIHAQIDGQPHVDKLGTVSVNPELVIQEDVGYETGNINFKGNVIVKGIVKEGFSVKCVNLTAQELDGAIVDLSGDLNVSAGINDSTVSVHGNVYAKFINNSTISGFGDVIISKEIIDSKIMLSGSCQNGSGHIISSKITTKLGIEAGSIGTSSAKPSHLKVGEDEHYETVKSNLDKALEASVRKMSILKDDIKALEDEDQALYETISDKAHIQDRAQLEIKEIKKTMPDIEKSNDLIKLSQAGSQLKSLVEKAKQAEKELNTIFETQDSIARRIEQVRTHIQLLEEKNKKCVLDKRALKEFADRHKPRSQVTVAKTIAQDTIIKAPHSSVVLKEDQSRCLITEMQRNQDGLQFFEILFSDL